MPIGYRVTFPDTAQARFEAKTPRASLALGSAYAWRSPTSPTKAAVIVRDDLAVWHRLNVTGFLVSGLIGSAEDRVVGEDYIDADGKHYLPMLVQPLLVLEASAAKLQTVRRRAAHRDIPIAIYTAELFVSGHDACEPGGRPRCLHRRP